MLKNKFFIIFFFSIFFLCQFTYISDVKATEKDTEIEAITSKKNNKIPDTKTIFKNNRLGELKDYTGGGTKMGEVQFKNSIKIILIKMRLFLMPMAIIFMTWSGIMLFLSRGNEEALKKAKNQMLSMAFGFSIFLLIGVMVERVFFGEKGEIFREGTDPNKFAKQGIEQLVGVFDFVSTFLVVIAVGYFVYTAFQLMLHGEEEQEMTNLKKRLIYGICGIAIIFMAKDLVRLFTLGEDAGKLAMPDVTDFIKSVMYWVNYFLGFIGLISVVALVWAGIRLVANFGDDQASTEAKKIAQASAIGLVLAFSSWTIIHFFITPA